MEMIIEEESMMILAGSSYYGTMKGEGWSNMNSIGYTWSRFSNFMDTYHDIYIDTCKDTTRDFELHIWQEDHWQKTKEQQVFTGYVVKPDKLTEIPIYLELKIIPPSRYAKFTIHGEEIKQHGKLIADVLNEKGIRTKKYQAATEIEIQVYSEEFNLENIEESVLQIWHPIE